MAAKSANLYARIEPDVKEKAESILSALGIPASNAINMFYKQIILNRGLRVMPVDNYQVFYIPDKDAGIVTVIRVMHAGRDVDSQLKGHTVM